mmetsp:Transcript_29144/g.21686  ORF Transcript_29144/g.21686 Transcript_29144/m.21686 type:complete len:127 (+) Transcript_29144:995-1375(+)
MAKGVAKQVVKKLLKKTGLHFRLFGTWFINCDLSKYEPLALLIDGSWVELAPEIFVRDMGYSFCSLGLMEIDYYGYWLMGGTLLRNYYSVWDDQNDRLGLAKIDALSISDIQSAGNPQFIKTIKTK